MKRAEPASSVCRMFSLKLGLHSCGSSSLSASQHIGWGGIPPPFMCCTVADYKQKSVGIWQTYVQKQHN